MTDALRGAAGRDEELRRRLFQGDRPVPTIWRAGRLLEPDAPVAVGDVLDLVTAISGG